MAAPIDTHTPTVITPEELRDYLTVRRLPADLAVRARACRQNGDSAHSVASGVALSECFSADELDALSVSGAVPGDFPVRVRHLLDRAV